MISFESWNYASTNKTKKTIEVFKSSKRVKHSLVPASFMCTQNILGFLRHGPRFKSSTLVLSCDAHESLLNFFFKTKPTSDEIIYIIRCKRLLLGFLVVQDKNAKVCPECGDRGKAERSFKSKGFHPLGTMNQFVPLTVLQVEPSSHPRCGARVSVCVKLLNVSFPLRSWALRSLLPASSPPQREAEPSGV